MKEIYCSGENEPYNFPPMPREYFERFPPQGSVLNPDTTLHCVGHAARVMPLGYRLLGRARKSGIFEIVQPVMLVLSIHDIFRETDHEDEPHHGLLAANWASREGLLTGPHFQMMRFLLQQHSTDDSESHAMDVPLIWKYALRIVKDADSLDRVRSGDLDPRYLRNRQSQHMIPGAVYLYEESKDKTDPLPHIIRSGAEIGWIG